MSDKQHALSRENKSNKNVSYRMVLESLNSPKLKLKLWWLTVLIYLLFFLMKADLQIYRTLMLEKFK